MPSQTITISEKQAEFIRRSLDTGRFQDAGEVIEAGLLLLQQQDTQDRNKLEAFRDAVAEGFAQIDQGEYTQVEPDKIGEFMDKIDRTVRPGHGR